MEWPSERGFQWEDIKHRGSPEREKDEEGELKDLSAQPHITLASSKIDKMKENENR